MKPLSVRLPIASLFAFVLTLQSGCGTGYLMQASDWGERVRGALSKLTDIQSAASNPAQFFADAEAQKKALATLDEVDAVLTEIESEYPDSPPSYHDYLVEGIDEMQAAIVVGREGIQNKDLAKMQKFREQANAAGTKIKTWGDKAQGG